MELHGVSFELQVHLKEIFFFAWASHSVTKKYRNKKKKTGEREK